jgi:hypothetical protein
MRQSLELLLELEPDDAAPDVLEELPDEPFDDALDEEPPSELALDAAAESFAPSVFAPLPRP